MFTFCRGVVYRECYWLMCKSTQLHSDFLFQKELRQHTKWNHLNGHFKCSEALRLNFWVKKCWINKLKCKMPILLWFLRVQIITVTDFIILWTFLRQDTPLFNKCMDLEMSVDKPYPQMHSIPTLSCYISQTGNVPTLSSFTADPYISD